LIVCTLARVFNKERAMATTEKERLWARRMTEWERSGTSRRTWCAANEVSIHTFDYWRRRLRTRVAKRPARQKLVPMVVKSAPTTSSSPSAATVEIALPRGIALRTPATADVRWLAALVREIEAC
jgi:hypothetical protein